MGSSMYSVFYGKRFRVECSEIMVTLLLWKLPAFEALRSLTLLKPPTPENNLPNMGLGFRFRNLGFSRV